MRYLCLLERVTLCTLLLLLLSPFTSRAQTDEEASDTTMQIKRFSYSDLDSEKFEKYKTSSSTNRLAENPEDLTQEVIIVDGDEIRKFGHTTLVDVLKTIPGFHTSQPGNSLEGETFLMRGLLGNDHTKILINGIPIKPEGVISMPIAAQLPIRHAEYIEIVQGPSSSTYGSDAMAGVINIVLPEVDRPVFAWADVSGATPATTDINLTLGGMAGKGKNVVNYQIFASSQRASDTYLLFQRDSILIDVDSLNQWERQYYLPDKDDKAIPEVNTLTRSSRLIGGNIKFRGFELFAMNMFREEHAAFGFSPLAISYSDPSTLLGENINSVGLRFVHDNKRRFSSRTSLSTIYYETLENSNYVAIRDSLAAGRNFVFGRSLDLRADYQGIIRFNDRFKMAFGSTGMYSVTNPFTSHLGRRVHLETNSFNLTGADLNPSTVAKESIASDTISAIGDTTMIPRYDVINVAGFVHFLYKTKNGKLNMEGAARVDVNTTDGVRFTPKFGLIYKPNKRWNLIANFGGGHRTPRSYHLYNNYWQRGDDPAFQNQPPTFDNLELKRKRDELKTERLQGFEFRAVWNAMPNLRFSGRYYNHVVYNRITRQTTLDPPPGGALPPDFRFGYGYFNNRAEGTISFLNALMVVGEFQHSWKNVSLRLMGSFEFSSGFEEIESEQNVTDFVEATENYRFVPTRAVKFNAIVEFKGFTVSVNNNIFGEFISDIYVRNNRVEYSEFNGVNYNMDIFIHKKLFRQLSLFMGANNVMNSFQTGIPAASLSNSWGYNPQYGRVFKFGLNFRLN
ncbi:MAG: TonB-dependent receptor [bacterium]|nr:TonB-dependent receptor [bacterium]